MSPFLALTRHRRARRGVPTPAEFDAIRDALNTQSDICRPCEVLGANLAADGWTLEEALDGLEATYRNTLGLGPDLVAVRALLSAWSEATLKFLHDVSCEDPLTGLASMRHLRARLGEIYRGASAAGTTPSASHGLVVVQPSGRRGQAGLHSVDWELRLAEIGETVRAVYPGSETVGRVGAGRVVAVVRRDDDLGERVALLRQVLSDWNRDTDGRKIRHRVWIEGLPRHHDHAVHLIDELAR